MNRATRSALDELAVVEWFRNVGRKVDHPRVRTLESWEAAIAHCTSPEWENYRITAASRISTEVGTRSRERLRLWNDIVDELEPVVEPFVHGKVARVISENNLRDEFEINVRSDIMHLCIETEYSDMIPLGGYAGLAHWYLEGHFPCGWLGEPPAGTLIIY